MCHVLDVFPGLFPWVCSYRWSGKHCFFTWTPLSFFIFNIKMMQLHSLSYAHTYTLFSCRYIATWGNRKWHCFLPPTLASKIRLEQHCSTARWLPLSALCSNSRTLFTVHLSVWQHNETPLDQFPPVVWLSDLISMATVITSSKRVSSNPLHWIWHLEKWRQSVHVSS